MIRILNSLRTARLRRFIAWFCHLSPFRAVPFVNLLWKVDWTNAGCLRKPWCKSYFRRWFLADEKHPANVSIPNFVPKRCERQARLTTSSENCKLCNLRYARDSRLRNWETFNLQHRRLPVRQHRFSGSVLATAENSRFPICSFQFQRPAIFDVLHSYKLSKEVTYGNNQFTCSSRWGRAS